MSFHPTTSKFDLSRGNVLGASRVSQSPIRCSASFAMIVLAVAVAASGCQKREARVPVVPVKGKVVAFKGEVPAGAYVALWRLDGQGPENVAPSATVGPDGSFAIGSYDTGDGAPPGDYAVTVTWFKVIDAGPGPNVLPAKFASASSTPLKVTVSGPTEIPPIEFN